jgi:4'-phosphopantetheinyl transferase
MSPRQRTEDARILSSEERNRADQFLYEKDRSRYVAVRSLLRRLLGGYLKAEPEGLALAVNAFGKPRLGFPWNQSAIEFNLSHAADFALLGFAKGRQIGVDLEKVRSGVEIIDIAEGYFSKEERDRLLQTPAEVRNETFFEYWTAKEAYVKACGEGLSRPLNQFQIVFDQNLGRLESESSENSGGAEPWTILKLKPVPSYVAAAAIQGSGLGVRCYVWPAQDPSITLPDAFGGRPVQA